LVGDLPRVILATYFPSVRTKPTTISVDPATLKSYSGTYLGDRLSTSTAERFFLGLIAETIKVSASSKGLEVNGLPVAAIRRDEFAIDHGDTLVFQRDAQGRVSELKTNLESFKRLSPWRTPMFLVLLCGLTLLLCTVNLASGWRAVRGGGNLRMALRLNLAASLAWLVCIGCLASSITQMTRSPLDVVFIYPPTVLLIGLWAGVCAATLSIVATVAALASRASSTRSRRFQYAASTILWTLLMLALYDWRLLGISH
jgi:hypothetical protein